MQMMTPDSLSSVDRTPSVAGMIAAAASSGTAAVGQGLGTGGSGRIGRTFSDILNAHKTTATDAADSESPAVGQSFGDFLNHRRTQLGLQNEDVQKEGESATAFLNRHKNPAATPTMATGAKASALTGTAVRPGETATQELNADKTVDEAAERHATAEKAAEGLVSNALILPILKQVRRSAFAQNDVFSGGNGEKAFGPEFDMQLSDRIAKSPRLGVKNALVAKLEKHHGVTPQTTKTAAVKQTKRLDVNG
jgi:Rod binding domain-containing protein